MIAIFSNNYEETTSWVIRWLNYYNYPFIRINNLLSDRYIYNINFGINEKYHMKVRNKEIDLKSINTVWYRRRDYPKKIEVSDSFDRNTYLQINRNVTSEEEGLFIGLVNSLNHADWLNHPKNAAVNKQLQLIIATKLGIKIPITLITNKKDILINFCKQHPKVIIKNIKDVRPITFKDKYYISLAKILDKNFVENLPDNFFPALLQEYIEKKFEIRTFYLDGKFFSMAMFTQTDEKTSIDFRRYNFTNPTRRIPYNLPNLIENQLEKFMQELQLNSGSIDMIYTKQNEYVFLEVNPIGQFGMLSNPCNYCLEEKVAKWLMKTNKI